MSRVSRIPHGRYLGDVARALETFKRESALGVPHRAVVAIHGAGQATELARRLDVYRRELAAGVTVKAAPISYGDRDATDIALAVEHLRRGG